MDINSFRRERLYTRPVVAFFEDNKPLLKAIFDIFRGQHRRMVWANACLFGVRRRELALCISI
jgi:hypothetical protein